MGCSCKSSKSRTCRFCLDSPDFQRQKLKKSHSEPFQPSVGFPLERLRQDSIVSMVRILLKIKKRPQTSRAQDLLDCLDNVSLCDTSNSSNDYLDGGTTHEESHLGNNEFSSHITSEIYVLKYLDFTEGDLLKQVRVF